jgi:hypothetical protein
MVADIQDSDSPEIEGDRVIAPAGSAPTPVSVYSGHALVVSEVNDLARDVLTRVVLFAGPIASGKTTLITSLYEAFRAGEFADCLFAGSRTLLGFEQRCHLSRAASELTKEETERTKAENEDVVLHLNVQRQDGAQINLLLCDISGELFRAAGEANEAFDRIPFLSAASQVVLFLDGAKLVDPGARHGARQEFLTLLRGGIETGAFGSQTRLDVVFSKHDVIDGNPDHAGVYAFEAAIQEECKSKFSAKVASLAFHNIAARPKLSEQVALLFAGWLPKKPAERVQSLTEVPPEARQIDSFGAKEALISRVNDGAGA